MKANIQVDWLLPALRRQMVLAVGALIIVFCAQHGIARATTILIDNFSDPANAQSTIFHIGAGMNPSQPINQSATGVIGGMRNGSFNVMGLGQPNSAVGMIGHDNVYNLNALELATNGLSPTVTTLEYGKNSPLAADLSADGSNNSFLLVFYSSDAVKVPAVPNDPGMDIAITVTSPGQAKTATTHVPNSGSMINVSVPFSSFPNIDFSDVSTISYQFNSANLTPNVDFELHMLAVVPEPTSALLMIVAAGFWALIVVRARRSKRRLGLLPVRFSIPSTCHKYE